MKLQLVSVVVSLSLFSSSLLAQSAQRAFVSAGSGSDANPCTRPSPCRNFAAAISQVIAGGEVVVLDSGGYGSVNITKSVSLVSPSGVYAGITALGTTNAIDINAANTDTVVLRGLTVKGVGSGRGINGFSVGTLYVDGCMITDITSDPLLVGFSAGPGVTLRLFVTDTVIRNCAAGIGGFGNTRATVQHCRFEKNDTGILAAGAARVNVSDSVAAENAYGFAARGQGVIAAELNITNCIISGNGTGVLAGAGFPFDDDANVRIRHCTIIDNNTGIEVDGPAHVYSYGDNARQGNTTDAVGTVSPLSLQ